MNQASHHAAAARIAKRQAADAAGIDAEFIDQLVERFYDKVRFDPVLAPIFAARITDWPPHLTRMKQFWGVILRGEGSFNGTPMALHAAIPGIEAPHFQRWLSLFAATLRELEGDPAATALVLARAETIADSLLTGIRIKRDPRLALADRKGLHHA